MMVMILILLFQRRWLLPRTCARLLILLRIKVIMNLFSMVGHSELILLNAFLLSWLNAPGPLDLRFLLGFLNVLRCHGFHLLCSLLLVVGVSLAGSAIF